MMRVLHLINTFTSGDERDKRAQEGELEPKNHITNQRANTCTNPSVVLAQGTCSWSIISKMANLSFCAEVRSTWAAAQCLAADKGTDAGARPREDTGGAPHVMRYDDTRILPKPFLIQVFQESSLSRYVLGDRKPVSPLPSLRFATLPIMNERIPCCLSTPFACLTTPPSPTNHGRSRSAPSKQHHAESTCGVQNLFSLLEHQLFHVVHRSSRLQTLSCFTCQRTSAAFSSTTWFFQAEV